MKEDKVPTNYFALTDVIMLLLKILLLFMQT